MTTTTKPWPTIDNVHGDRFHAGVYSDGEFTRDYVTLLFEQELVKRVDGVYSYAICYGELCAYSSDRKLLGVLSAELPDNALCLNGRSLEEDVKRLAATFKAASWCKVTEDDELVSL